ncbi:MAG: DUF721 domain-containing protein [Candidatus Cloacimonetes bacterium]|nr:DUF721 domain-containing protein [Candidatus Cloacimonadota bacterium]
MGWKAVGGFISEAVLHIAGQKLHDYTLVRLRWQEVVGATVARNASPRKLENGILKVGVKNSIWLQEMILYKYKIISSYKRYGLPIKDIIFFLNTTNNEQGNVR